ncbi:MAG TPA: UDP-N-acetylglucosamine--N-acetylmuramyl-(pentapeptide) pyrophosphoryl-undecaprenol N-acetylglucosamine transferase [Candidatus Saccharimonadales bacterium]|nr:UDP-N-acetylglucosamine--N-acetylmuramyl-(pentapeptide) pyrophosphoryl-undecaprenol N-acetylglucosamine transferase [Candidatus Saccharimonadales bacterium]
MRKIIVTGGHLTPALATIEELQKNPEVEIVFIGRSRSTEGDKAASAESVVIPNLGIKFYSITPGRIQRRFTRYTLWSIGKIPIGVFQALGILSKERPSAILSFGSYVAAPVVFAGWVLGVPIITHEQTLNPGLSNKFVSRFAKKIAVSWEESLDHFPKSKAVLTGNPIRAELLNLSKKRAARPTIYITGGNQGAHIINEMVLEILHELLEKYNVVHQSGTSQTYKDFETLTAFATQLPPKLAGRYKLGTWFDSRDSVEIFSAASLVVGRSGANTVAEAMALAIPAVFIPLPIAAKNEQMKNAQVMEKLGAAVILPQERLTPKRLLAAINLVMHDYKKYQSSAKSGRRNLNLDAAKILARETLKLVN